MKTYQEIIYTDSKGKIFCLETYKRWDGKNVYAVFSHLGQETPFSFSETATICDFFVQNFL